MEGKTGPRASPEEGLQTYRWLDGQMSKSGHGRSSYRAQLRPGPRAELSVVLDGEFVLGGLLYDVGSRWISHCLTRSVC